MEYILYHGSISTNNFKRFRASKHGYLGQGVYFSNKEEIAKKYALKYGCGQLITAKIELNDNEILKIISSNPIEYIFKLIYKNKNVYEQRKKVQGNECYLIEQKDINKLKKKGFKVIEFSLPLCQDEKEYLILDLSYINIIDRKII